MTWPCTRPTGPGRSAHLLPERSAATKASSPGSASSGLAALSWPIVVVRLY